MNSLNARESTLQRNGINAKGANTNVTNAAKIDTRLPPEPFQSYVMKQNLQHPYHFYSSFQYKPFTLRYQNMIGKAVLRI